MSEQSNSILLIDDDADLMEALKARLVAVLGNEPVEIRTWWPRESEPDVYEAFKSRIDESSRFVVTDYDLTRGVKGLFGLSVVAWCQREAIPVGDFSRGRREMLPAEPNLFEIRVPVDEEEAASLIATVYRGFKALCAAIAAIGGEVSRGTSLASVLAMVFDRPNLESEFSPYMARLGAANSSLMQQVSDDPQPPDVDRKVRILAYVLGHVLWNSILRYPGPILSDQALCAYFCTTIAEAAALAELFKNARYHGPFAGADRYFWRADVDVELERLSQALGDKEFADFGDLNRAVAERALGRELATHACPREECYGKKGGFWCPFSCRPVCIRADCSVASSSWIPEGAILTRVERDVYDEWSPLLGL